ARAFDRDTRHLETEDRERHRDAVIAGRLHRPFMQGPRHDADRVGERLRVSAERVDPVGDRLHAVALLFAGVRDPGELGGFEGRCRYDRQARENVRAIAYVRGDPMQVADTLDGHGTGAVRHSAAHRPEELEEARIALTARADTGVDVLDRHGPAQDGGRGGGIRRGGHITGYADVACADLAFGDADHVAGALDPDAPAAH